MMDGLLMLLMAYGSWVVLCWVFLDLAFVPVPSEIVLVVAGSLAVSGQLGLGFIILAGVLGALSADHLWFYLGRKQGGPALHLLCRLTSRSSQCREKTLAFFSRFGSYSLLVAKFFPGLRTVVPSMAGASRVPYLVFLGADGLGSMVWVGVVAGLGYVFARKIKEILAVLQGFHTVALWAAVGMAVGLSMLGHLYRGRRARSLRSHGPCGPRPA